MVVPEEGCDATALPLRCHVAALPPSPATFPPALPLLCPPALPLPCNNRATEPTTVLRMGARQMEFSCSARLSSTTALQARGWWGWWGWGWWWRWCDQGGGGGGVTRAGHQRQRQGQGVVVVVVVA